jgi:molecular chaperone DnaK
LNVSAKDVGTGKEQKITIQAGTRMSEDEIKRMVKDAEVHAEDDKKKRQSVEARNQLDGLVFQAEKMLKDNADKVPADLKSELEGAVSEAKSKLDSQDYDTLVKARENLESRVHKMAENIYKAAGTAAGGEAGPSTGQSAGSEASGNTGAVKDNVVDAEYEEGPR